MDDSILASLGKFIQPLFTPLGFGSQLGPYGWMFAVAAATGLIAKENVIATFASLAACVIAGFEGTEDGILEIVTMISIMDNVTVATLISFIAFNLTTVPCFASVAAAKGELGKGKFRWTLLFWLTASYLIGTLVYTVGSWWWTAFVWAALAIFTWLGIVLYNKKRPIKK